MTLPARLTPAMINALRPGRPPTGAGSSVRISLDRDVGVQTARALERRGFVAQEVDGVRPLTPKGNWASSFIDLVERDYGRAIAYVAEMALHIEAERSAS